MTEGVIYYELLYDVEEFQYKTTVVFDEGRTTIAAIVDRLRIGGYPIRGEPMIIP